MQTKKCPVCGSEIKDGGVQAKIDGQQVTVCCDQCAKEAKEHPADYAHSST
jgi:ribosome-binding protein aMBF1 (putative translation factor)